MTSISDLIREDLWGIEPYSSARQEVSEGRIFLNANELPWGEEFTISGNDLNRYPASQPETLIEELAQFYGVDKRLLMMTRGSDDGIDLLIRLFCKAFSESIMICPPTFGMYEILARLQGAKVVKVPLQGYHYKFDREKVLSSWDETVKLIFLCSPNNPTGNLIDARDILSLCDKFSGRSIIVVDEAYIEFSGEKSLIEFICQYDNLVILRTLSKSFGLAGVRLGVLIGNEELKGLLKKILPPYPFSQLSIQAALLALKSENLARLQEKIKLVCQERDRLFVYFQHLKIVDRVWPSSANFILVKFKIPVVEICARHGLILRSMDKKVEVENLVRISVGTCEENNELIDFLSQL